MLRDSEAYPPPDVIVEYSRYGIVDLISFSSSSSSSFFQQQLFIWLNQLDHSSLPSDSHSIRKVTVSSLQAHASASQLEERKLKKKLDELMSDRALSSDEDDPKKPFPSKGSGVKGAQRSEQAPSVQEAALSSSSDEMPTEAQKVITHTLFRNLAASNAEHVYGFISYKWWHGDCQLLEEKSILNILHIKVIKGIKKKKHAGLF